MVYRTSDDELEKMRVAKRWHDVVRLLSERIESDEGDAQKRVHLRELIDLYENKFSNKLLAGEARAKLMVVDPDDLANVEALAGHLRARRDWLRLVTALDHLASRAAPEQQAPLLVEMEMVYRDRLRDSAKADAVAARRAALG